jgi:hypothetical protein
MLVGAAWGALLGGFAAFEAIAFALGASWLFLFGDDRWPAGVGPIILTIGALVWLAGVAIGGWAGYRAGVRHEAGAPAAYGSARRRAHLWLGAWAFTVALLIALAATSAGRDRADRELALERENRFAELVEARHRVERVAVDVSSPVLRVVTLHLMGEREGHYRLDWVLDDRTYRVVLEEGTRALALGSGGDTVRIRFEMATLRDRYLERVLSGARGVLVEEDFQLHLTLTPDLDESERASIPPREIHNLGLGESGLIFRETAPVPVRFEIR